MNDDSPLSEVDPNGDTGNPYTGISSPPFETKDQPPFLEYKSKNRLPDLVARGVTVTLRIAPYAITIWLFAPDDVKYEARKYARYLPWAVKYAIWWLKQNA